MGGAGELQQPLVCPHVDRPAYSFRLCLFPGAGRRRSNPDIPRKDLQEILPAASRDAPWAHPPVAGY